MGTTTESFHSLYFLPLQFPLLKHSSTQIVLIESSLLSQILQTRLKEMDKRKRWATIQSIPQKKSKVSAIKHIKRRTAEMDTEKLHSYILLRVLFHLICISTNVRYYKHLYFQSTNKVMLRPGNIFKGTWVVLLLLLLLLSRFSRVRLCATPQMAAIRLPCPWDSPGKSTGVGCQCLLRHGWC